VYYVCVLKLIDGSIYVGFSSDLKKRIGDHKQGRVKTTKGLFPKLVSYIAFCDEKKARRFERYLKIGSGFAFRNKHLV
jgi:putative endonuclease